IGSTSSVATKSSMKLSVAKRSSDGRLKAPASAGSVALVSAGHIGDAAVHSTRCSMPHQMFPAPGVYDALMTLLVITVSAITTPLKRDRLAFTETMLAVTSMKLAVTLTLAEAVIVMPLGWSLTALPLLSTI